MYYTIGKSVLYQALGLKQNNKELVLNNKKSACASCPWYQAASSSFASKNSYDTLKAKCAHCENNIDYEVIYNNEKNKYGSDKTKLNRNALILFMKLHSYNPTQAGFIENIDVDVLADLLKVSVRTVRNNLKLLVDGGYIYCDSIYANHVNLILLNYKDYFLPADKGGRGYLKISENTLKDLCNIRSILVLRLILRNLLSEKENNSNTYKDLNNCLPCYCKKNVIISKIKEHTQNIFEIVLSDKHVNFKIKQEHDIKINLANEEKTYSEHYNNIFNKINKVLFDSIGSNIMINNIPLELTPFFIDDNKQIIENPVSCFYYKKAIPDLAKLACKYSEPVVTRALADTYKLHMCKQKPLLKHLGSYILEVIKSYGFSINNAPTLSNI